ncbi:SHOCT-like domain-containing protein [Neobacillus sp. NPDC093182]|uniref:SHOCT-like domain-containing protein n=1 Tax=Neobacillus sp. NPDC093182 TaxID=3364297 RepID=UPI00380B35B0
MKDEISRVLTLVEEGKIDKEKASELITILQGKDQPGPVTIKKEAPYGTKMLKIRVTSQEGDNVNVNLPINLVKAVLKVGTNIAEKIPEAEKYVKDINVDLLIEAIENELDGEIVNITSANGDKVFVVIE